MIREIVEFKTKYNKGQLFPYLIAIMVIIIILTMITVNLGQIGAFRTDVSNAADSGALSAVSILSGTLLGLGLRSDMMCGFAIVSLIGIIIALLIPDIGIEAAIAIYIAMLVSQIVDWLEALGETRMGWTNAKQTALSYGFNNVGVDEPRPTFKQFLKNAYHICSPDDPEFADPARCATNADTVGLTIQTYSDEYIRGESANARAYGRSGFARFMEDYKRGRWSEHNFGEVHPAETSSAIVTNGYGWTQNADGTFANSYCDTAGNAHDNATLYKNFDNFAEVEAIGSTQYPVMFYTMMSEPVLLFIASNFAAIIWVVQFAENGNWLWGAIIATIYAAVFLMMVTIFFPLGLCMGDAFKPEVEDEQTTDNPFLVRVSRYKRPQNLGLWNFRYGSPGIPVQARARSHAFKENDNVTIRPTFLSELVDMLQNLGSGDETKFFDKQRHLFETELISTF